MGGGLIFKWSYGSVHGMKKFYNLFSWVVCVNLIVLVAPWRAMAEGVGDVLDVGDEVVANDGGGGDEEVDLPTLYIKAINPGYKVDGVSDVGEMIEIRKNSDDLISLAGVTVRYTNSSGKDTELVKFPENSYMAGESLVLRYDKTVGSELSNATYNATLALKAGPVSLLVDDEVVDSVCWTGKEGCAKYFASGAPTTLVRDAKTGEFEHMTIYEPEYDEESIVAAESEELGEDEENEDGEEKVEDASDAEENLDEKPDEDEKNDEETGVDGGENGDKNPVESEKKVEEQCRGLVFSEILSYYAETQAEQFIELYNDGVKPIVMDGCMVRYKGKVYPLEGVVGAGEYAVRWVTDFRLTKNPTGSNVLEVVDADGETVDTVEYFNGQNKGAAWALVGYEAEEEIWRMTYAVTPGEVNVYQEYRTCEEGKIINEATGKCVKATGLLAEDDDGYGAETKTCAEGQYLNPLTGRCKKIEDEAQEKTCSDGYYLNEETGRCRKIVEEVIKTCKEGYYLNEETGRCRKIQVATAKTCREGYYLNEETGRCRKIVVEEEKICKEGYYLNEETGRCRKIVENAGADYKLATETYEEESSFVALYAVLGVVGAGVLYVAWEFRREIGRFFKRLLRK